MTPADAFEELRSLVWWMDQDLDDNVDASYLLEPLAQHWARVAKVAEETGEAIDALIGLTDQNPRKGFYASEEDLLACSLFASLLILHGGMAAAVLSHGRLETLTIHAAALEGNSSGEPTEQPLRAFVREIFE